MKKVLLIEDDFDFAHFLTKALKNDPELEIVETITNETDAKRYFADTRLVGCDGVLLDLQLPVESGDRSARSLSGLSLLDLLRKEYRYGGTIIVLTNSKAPEDGQRALAAGCDGYLCKRGKPGEIGEMLKELHMALTGGVIMIAQEMRHVFMRDGISAKEARMLDLLAEGKSWPEIAKELGYGSTKTAANLGDRLFDKLLTTSELERASRENLKKRDLAVEVWLKRKNMSPNVSLP